ncbi:peptidoglycan-binding protein [Streptomyces sp. NPDC052107]|uniref:peptidoglycan-binding protein n=1 Tax=Streptomyces sp. NPDC052107 TaxID=3155632 RepID=UPI003424D519
MSGSGEKSALFRRKRLLGGLAGGSVLLAATALWTSAYVKSPAQAAADARPPAADVLTAPVERRVLSDTVVTRGTVSASQAVDVAASGTAAEGGLKPVVTKVMMHSGQTFPAGRVLIEVSGRPLFALRGSLPVYRDLKPGAHGDDVRQLQSALRELGHPTGSDRPGVFGPGTKRAVAALYEAIGYEPVTTDGSAADTARTDVKRARRELDRLIGKGASAEDIGFARSDLADAESGLAKAESVSGPMVPASEVVFLSGFPARVESLGAKVGAEAGEKLATVSAGRLVINGSLSLQDKGLVHSGQKVRVYSEVTGDELTGTVARVADAPTTSGSDADGQDGGQDGEGYAVTVTPGSPLPVRLAGQDVRLTIEAASSGHRVLVVPVSAISAGADSRTTVTVLDRSGTRRRVEVRTGTSGDGYTAVTPVGGARLLAGDKVVVGVAPGSGTVR